VDRREGGREPRPGRAVGPRVALNRIDGRSVLDAVPKDARRGEVTDQATPGEVEAARRGALLTGEELAGGAAAWQASPDPFGDWHEEPCEDTETGPARQGATAANR
jgi:hypothetical protein